ncbi:hypothetical protein ALC62_00798 [Cyphomyrmex costatus]|uniref:HAT C-terminal dimerisation domain-containing protein n=1 Tax=Cyphomyrmex costatus TaxID=456900 RepID=A0A151IQB5_9HYME|nr:hypothetical protein ALC62_00798 [Cyphomyrmex costatus]
MYLQFQFSGSGSTSCSTSPNSSGRCILCSHILKSKENILQFWKKNKRSMPDLYKLANIVLAVPSTKVSVERLFSSLKYILSPLRSNLNENIINDILLIRANVKKQ